MSTVVVTGANGFIGRYVSRACANHGHYVIGIGHGDWTKETQTRWGLSEWHELDVSLSSLVSHGSAAQLIIHCAGSGSVGFSLENPAQDFERTVNTTQEVLEFIRTCSPSTRLVYPSSAAVYGQASPVPIHENAPLCPVSPYGVHKKIAEDLCRSYGAHFGVSIASVRIFSAYGPELRKQLLWDACRKVRNGVPSFSGSGNESRDWINVADVAELLYLAGRHANPAVPVVNGATGVETPIRDIVRLLASSLGSELNPMFDGVQRSGDPERLVGSTEGSRVWDWEPRISWQQGVREYVEWYRGVNND